MPGESIQCNDCDQICQSMVCYENHKATTERQEFSICDRVYQCRTCCKVIKRREYPREFHCCGTTRCPSCKKFVVLENHGCFLKAVTPKKSSEKLIFFDFETDQAFREHTVNFVVAQYADGTERIFKGYEACDNFCSWLFTPAHKGYTAIAHNKKGFDGQFILSWLLRQGTAPEIIPNGAKVMSIANQGIRIIDSFNFLPMALTKIPACFGLEELKKGYFPHLFNTQENQEYVGSLPELHYYSPETMSPSAHTEFMAWHKKHKGNIFHFQNEMLSYCKC